MTKRRAPLSIENMLDKMIGDLTIEVAAEAAERTPGYLRALSDPDRREQLTVRDVVALDLAWRRSGRPGYPLHDTIGRMLDTADADRTADAASLVRSAKAIASENGDAIVALLMAADNLTIPAIEATLHELEQLDGVTDAAIADVRCLLERQRGVHPSQAPP